MRTGCLSPPLLAFNADIMMEHPVTGDKSPDAKANGRENYSGVPEGITEH